MKAFLAIMSYSILHVVIHDLIKTFEKCVSFDSTLNHPIKRDHVSHLYIAVISFKFRLNLRLWYGRTKAENGYNCISWCIENQGLWKLWQNKWLKQTLNDCESRKTKRGRCIESNRNFPGNVAPFHIKSLLLKIWVIWLVLVASNDNSGERNGFWQHI